MVAVYVSQAPETDLSGCGLEGHSSLSLQTVCLLQVPTRSSADGHEGLLGGLFIWTVSLTYPCGPTCMTHLAKESFTRGLVLSNGGPS